MEKGVGWGAVSNNKNLQKNLVKLRLRDESGNYKTDCFTHWGRRQGQGLRHQFDTLQRCKVIRITKQSSVVVYRLPSFCLMLSISSLRDVNEDCESELKNIVVSFRHFLPDAKSTLFTFVTFCYTLPDAKSTLFTFVTFRHSLPNAKSTLISFFVGLFRKIKIF